MPESVVRKFYQWGTRSKYVEYGNKIQFLNCTNQKFDWDNYELEDHDELVKDEAIAHTEIPSEMPDIYLE